MSIFFCVIIFQTPAKIGCFFFIYTLKRSNRLLKPLLNHKKDPQNVTINRNRPLRSRRKCSRTFAGAFYRSRKRPALLQEGFYRSKKRPAFLREGFYRSKSVLHFCEKVSTVVKSVLHFYRKVSTVVDGSRTFAGAF